MHALFALPVALLLAVPGHAATLSAYVSLIERDVDGITLADAIDDQFTFDSAADGPTIAAAAALPTGGSGFQGAATVNALTGRMTTEVTKPARHGEASASAGITEFFTAIGSGTVRFCLDLAGAWSVPNLHGAGASEVQLLSSIIFERLGDPESWTSVDDAVSSISDPSLPASGAFARTITFDAFLEDGAEYVISGGIMSYLAGGPTEADARLSGTFFFSAPGGVALAFDDPALFSQVPLPLGGLLLLTGLGAFGVIGRRRRGLRPARPARTGLQASPQ